jgi:transcriptional regulator with GAF, ATPase, and Fis domain
MEILHRGNRNLALDIISTRSTMYCMDTFTSVEESHVDILHEIGERLGTEDGLHEVLTHIVEFATGLVKCDSCLIYVLEGDELVLRGAKDPHPEVVDRLKLRVGQGITGWVAEHHEPVAIPEGAAHDPRFQFFYELPEDRYEAFLSVPLMCRGRVVGVINLQHRQHHVYRHREIRLLSTEMATNRSSGLPPRNALNGIPGGIYRRQNAPSPRLSPNFVVGVATFPSQDYR